MDSYILRSRDDVSELTAQLPQRISDVTRRWADQSPDHPALVEASGAWTYRELQERIDETAAWLASAGVRAGDRVMFVCENSRAFVAALLAAASIDAWPVLVNARLSAREVDLIREHSDPRLILYTTSVSPHATEHAKRHGAAIQEVGRLGMIGVGVVNTASQAEADVPDVPSRIGALIYTSGTTGLPKGVMLSHRGLLFVGIGAAKLRGLDTKDRMLAILPMSHSVGLSVVLLGGLYSGATLYLGARFDPVKALQLLEKEKLTVLLGSPSMFSLLLDYAKLKGLSGLEFPALRVISSSGAPLQAPIKAGTEGLLGRTLHNGYGVTETSPNIAITRLDRPRSDLSVGEIFPGIEVKLMGSNGKPVGPGEVGELLIRGPNVMRGYYKAPEETAAAIDPEGWLNTRDLARMDGDHLFIEGRTKELIVRFGLNVYPAEVETVLNAHPAVARSAVIGRTVAGIDGGEEVLAFVQLAEGKSAAAAELMDFVSQRLAPYKRPSRITLVPSMPLTTTGKIVKEELAKAYPEA
jgi:acyl-CoA synthetase (AMP-forming)/AMP-acid ligase II